MTEVYRFSEPQLLCFFLVLMRMTAFVFAWPVFGVETISTPIKILFALTLTFVVFPTLHFRSEQLANVKADIWIPVLRELGVGLALGYLARFFFFAFQIAGELISQSMGLTAAQLFHPGMGAQSSAIEQFYFSLVSLFYLAVNGHHFLISGLVETFEAVPVALTGLNTAHFGDLGLLVQQVCELGLKFSAPVLVSILMVNLVLGVLGKTVPQLNVLVTSFPINIMVGFLLMLVTLPMWMDQMEGFLEVSTTQVFRFVKAF